MQLDKLWEFWFLAFCVGCFQGGIQALSRSYFAKIIPEEQSGEYFGLFDICGKGASFLGLLVVGVVTQATGNQSFGVACITVLFLLGFFLFSKAARMENDDSDPGGTHVPPFSVQLMETRAADSPVCPDATSFRPRQSFPFPAH